VLLIDLIEALQDQLDSMSDAEQRTAEVRLMTQPQWPFEHTLTGVVAEQDIPALDYDEEDPDDGPDGYAPCDGPGCRVVYLLEGSQIGYGTKAAWD
jgi:hypothetical protein